MCTLMTVIGTIVVARIAFRMAGFRPCQLAGDCDERWAGHFHHRRGFSRARVRDAMDTARAPDVALKIDELLRSLDLNARQAAEASDVISIVRGAVGTDHYTHEKGMLLALRAAAKLPFDADLAEAAIGPRVSPAAAKEAIDALEHLHNILTDEQRATLEKLTARA